MSQKKRGNSVHNLYTILQISAKASGIDTRIVIYDACHARFDGRLIVEYEVRW
jgi:hypothetical protein